MADPKERIEGPSGTGAPLLRARSMTAWTMLSRVLGLVRDLLFAAFFGAGLHSDALKIAFRIPNLLRDLLAEGALSSAFVPAYSEQREKRGAKAATELASGVLTLLTLMTTAIVILGIIFAPAIVNTIVPGFSEGEDGDHKARETIELTRLLLPFLLFASWIALLGGILNTRNRFGLPAAQPVLGNFLAVSAGVALLLMTPSLESGARIWASALLAGGVAGVLMLLPAVRRGEPLGFRRRPWAPGMGRVIRQMLVLGMASSAAQVNIVINSGLASRLGTGAVSWLDYGFRLYYLPIGLIGVALGTVILVDASKLAARGETTKLRRSSAESQRMNLFLGVPAAVGLGMLAQPIIAALLQRGAFGAEDTLRTAEALRYLAIGVPFACMTKGLLPVTFALNREKLAAVSSLLAVIANLSWAIPMASPDGVPSWAAALSLPGGVEALALGTTIAAATQWLVLQIGLRRSPEKIPFPPVGLILPLVGISVALALTCRGVEAVVGSLEIPPAIASLIVVLVAVPLGGVLVVLIGKKLGLAEARALVDALRPSRKPPQPPQ